ncbi:MAG: hypothetical protein IKL24_05725, partial [Clostridia bacterium]|nr:hypothetical protein [Clostridia bacterium]
IKFMKKLNDKKTYTLVSAKKGSKSFKKYFKITIDCGNCDECDEICFGEDFDPLCDCDEDYVPGCSLDEAEEE